MLTFFEADGTCFIEPVLLNAGTVAHVKPTDAGIAALYVIRRCVGAHPPLGGASKNDGRRHVQILALRSEWLLSLLIMGI